MRSGGGGHITGFWQDWDQDPQSDLAKGIIVSLSNPRRKTEAQEGSSASPTQRENGLPQEEGRKAKSID